MASVKELAVEPAMKDIIEQLIAKHSGSVTKAAKAVGTSHQNLRNWQVMDVKAKDVQRFLEVAEKIFDVLKVPEGKRWEKLRGKK